MDNDGIVEIDVIEYIEIFRFTWEVALKRTKNFCYFYFRYCFIKKMSITNR